MIRTVLLSRRAVDLEGLHDEAVVAGLSVVGMSSSMDLACSLVRQRKAELLITETRADDGPALLAVQRLREFGTLRPLTILVQADDQLQDTLWKLLCVGVDSLWWRRGEQARSLATAATEALHSGSHVGADLARRVLAHMAPPHTPRLQAGDPEPVRLLSEPEQALMQALAQGRSAWQVAQALQADPATVARQVRGVLYKVRAAHRARPFLSLAA